MREKEVSIAELEKEANIKVNEAMSLVKNAKMKETLDEWKKSKNMKLKTLRKKILNNEITIDYKKHNKQSITQLRKHFLDEFEYGYRSALESVISLPDNFFSLVKYYAPIEFGKYIDIGDMYCWDCDARLRPILISEKKLTFISISKFFKIGEEKAEQKLIENKYDFRASLKDCPTCELHTSKYDLTGNKFVTQIEVPSGELMVKNFSLQEDFVVLMKIFFLQNGMVKIG